MAKRAAKPPQIDDVDVQQLADLILSKQESLTISDTELAKIAHQMGVLYGKANGTSAAWGREFANKVQRKVEFGRMAWLRSQRSN